MATLVNVNNVDECFVRSSYQSVPLKFYPNESKFVTFDVQVSPSIHHYRMTRNWRDMPFNLVLSGTKTIICNDLLLDVVFSDRKAAKIDKIHQMYMGFYNKHKIMDALIKWNWDELKAANWLETH